MEDSASMCTPTRKAKAPKVSTASTVAETASTKVRTPRKTKPVEVAPLEAAADATTTPDTKPARVPKVKPEPMELQGMIAGDKVVVDYRKDGSVYYLGEFVGVRGAQLRVTFADGENKLYDPLLVKKVSVKPPAKVRAAK